MKLDHAGRCVSLIREGDYFVVRTSFQGTGFDYSPDALPGARVIGAFCTGSTGVKYFDAEQTLALLERHGDMAEDHLMSQTKIADAKRLDPDTLSRGTEPSLTTKLVGGLTSMASTMPAGRTWTGTIKEFYRDVLCLLVSGVAFTNHTRKAIKGLGNLGIGVDILNTPGLIRLEIRWDTLAAHADMAKL